MKRADKLAVLRVLRLVDGMVGSKPQDVLLAIDGHLITRREVRRHVRAAINLMRRGF